MLSSNGLYSRSRGTAWSAFQWQPGTHDPNPPIQIDASGPTTYTYTPSGGITFAGTAPVERSKVPQISGGITFGGAAATSFHPGVTTYTYTGSGGIVFSGAAPVFRTKIPQISGGITWGGTAPVNRAKVPVVSGGITFSGSAIVQRSKVPQITGGITFGGTAPSSVEHVSTGGDRRRSTTTWHRNQN